MKSISIKLFYSLFVLTFILISCGEDEQDLLLTEENCFIRIKEGSNITEIEYEPDNSIIKINFDSSRYDDGSNRYRGYVQLDKNSKQQITKSQVYYLNLGKAKAGFQHTYEYNEDGLMKESYNYIRHFQTGAFSSTERYYVHQYTNKQLARSDIMVKTTYSPTGIMLYGYLDYSYDAKGNIIKVMEYGHFRTPQDYFIGSTEYNYDNKKNPYNFLSFFKHEARTISPNNIISSIKRDEKGNILKSVSNTFEYNEEGYPIKSATVVTGSLHYPNDSYTSSFEYNCL